MRTWPRFDPRAQVSGFRVAVEIATLFLFHASCGHVVRTMVGAGVGLGAIKAGVTCGGNHVGKETVLRGSHGAGFHQNIAAWRGTPSD